LLGPSQREVMYPYQANNLKQIGALNTRSYESVADAECRQTGNKQEGESPNNPASVLPGALHTDCSDMSSDASCDRADSKALRSQNSSRASSPVLTRTRLTSSFRQLPSDPEDGSSSTAMATQRPKGPLHLYDQTLGAWQEEPEEDEIEYETRHNKDILIRHLLLTSMSGRLTLINLSRRGLREQDANAIRHAIIQNPHLSVLKLSYNDLGDNGAAIISQGFVQHGVHHKNISVLDFGFNGIGDPGCAALALHAVAGNHALRTLYLSGNNIKQKGAMAIAGAILHGCSLRALHLSANTIGPIGMQALARAVAEREALRNVRGQDDSRQVDIASDCVSNFRTLEELHVSGCRIESGFVTIPSMLLTNFSMRVLCMSNNNIDDNDMALLAQALSRNKDVPLEVLELSHNSISCTGIECIMNAVWGSKTLREMRFDNNRIRDRGAQLFAVVLTSIALEVIDLSGNTITTVGIKALMKSLSENQSLSYLGLCGIPIDANSAKALSYGIAYNTTLKYLYIDKCSVGYAAQRHIVAGIVSNRYSALRVLTGFPIGAIVVTLGLPRALERWTNDQVLGFIRLMWKLWRNEQRIEDQEKASGPAAPASVIAAAKKAMGVIGDDGATALSTEPHERKISDSSPLATTNAALLERTLSGTLRVPPIVQGLKGSGSHPRLAEAWSESGMEKTSKQKARILSLDKPQYDPLRKEENLEWLRLHFRSLHEIGRMPFNNADLWQLHQYFFSPIAATESKSGIGGTTLETDSDERSSKLPASNEQSPQPEHFNAANLQTRAQDTSPLPADASHRASLGRAISFQMLGDAAAVTALKSCDLSSSCRRRVLDMVSGDDEDSDDFTESSSESNEIEPASKRARNFKPRIAYYPRIREKLESVGLKPTQETLSLLRQLKFVENVLFQGKDVYTDGEVREPDQPTPTDVEMIILDLL